MMKFIKIMLEILLPMVLIFGVLPRLFDIFKEVFVEEDKPKKKKKKPKLRQVGFPTLPPSPRREDSLRKFAENYEVRGGRIVKKEFTWEDEERLRRIRDGKSTEEDKRVYSEDGNSFTQNGKSYTKSDELGWDIPWFKEDEVKPETKKEKKKHFSKGVDPDFL
jgi:hypothetical protein